MVRRQNIVLILILILGLFGVSTYQACSGGFGEEAMDSLSGRRPRSFSGIFSQKVGVIEPVISENLETKTSKRELYLNSNGSRMPLSVLDGTVVTQTQAGVMSATLTGNDLSEQYAYLSAGQTVSVKGVLSGGRIAVSQKDITFVAGTSGGGGAGTMSVVKTSSVDDRSIAFLLGDAEDAASPCTKAQMEQILFGPGDSVKTRIEKMSNGRMSIHGKVFGPYPLGARTDSGCWDRGIAYGIGGGVGIDGWGDRLESQARASGEWSEGYQIEGVSFPRNNNCQWGGLVNAYSVFGIRITSGKRAYFNGSCYSAATLIHEFGHIWGLDHANSQDKEYGDMACAMGHGGDDYNAPHRDQMGFNLDRADANREGIYTLAPLGDHSGRAPQMIRAGDLHVSYRGPNDMAVEPNYRDRVYVHKWDEGLRSSMTVIRNVLDVGQQHVDLRAGWRVKNIGVVNGLAQVEIGKPTNVPPPPAIEMSLMRESDSVLSRDVIHVKRGDRLILNWNIDAATQIFIEPIGRTLIVDENGNDSLTGESALNGSTYIAPSDSTDVVVSAHGRGGIAEKRMQVIVDPADPVQCSVRVEPQVINPGESATWTIDAGNMNLVASWFRIQSPDQNKYDQYITVFGNGGTFSQTVDYTNTPPGTETRMLSLKNMFNVEMCNPYAQATLTIRAPQVTPMPTPVPVEALQCSLTVAIDGAPIAPQSVRTLAVSEAHQSHWSVTSSDPNALVYVFGTKDGEFDVYESLWGQAPLAFDITYDNPDQAGSYRRWIEVRREDGQVCRSAEYWIDIN